MGWRYGMRSWDGRVVRSAWAYARRSDGIIELCLSPTWTRPKPVSFLLPSNSNSRRGTTHVLQKPKHKQRQELHVLRNHQLGTRAAARARHRRLVRPEDVDELVHDGVPRVLELGLHGPLDGLVREEGREGDRVDVRVQVRNRARRREREGDDADATLAKGGRVEDGGLEDDERRAEGVFDLDLDRVGLVHWDGGEGEEVGRADEEVAVEGRHPDSWVQGVSWERDRG